MEFLSSLYFGSTERGIGKMDKVKIGITLSHLVNAVETIKTQDDLSRVWEQVNSVLKHRGKIIEMEISIGFKVGDKVQFAGRHGKPMQGTIIKKSDRTAKVVVGTVVDVGWPTQANWNVSWSLLKKAE